MLDLTLTQASRMASRNPAEFLGLDHERGRIAPGYLADLVLADDDLRVLDTWVGGVSTEGAETGPAVRRGTGHA